LRACFFLRRMIEQDEENGASHVDPIDSITCAWRLENFVYGPIFLCKVKEGLGTLLFSGRSARRRGRQVSTSKPQKLDFTKEEHNLGRSWFFRFQPSTAARRLSAHFQYCPMKSACRVGLAGLIAWRMTMGAKNLPRPDVGANTSRRKDRADSNWNGLRRRSPEECGAEEHGTKSGRDCAASDPRGIRRCANTVR